MILRPDKGMNTDHLARIPNILSEAYAGAGSWQGPIDL